MISWFNIQANYKKKKMGMAINELTRPKELISEAAQTIFRDSDSQYLNCDISKVPTQHPSKFSRGKGLFYPILYDPAWPIHIAARKKDVKIPILKKKIAFESYALKGITLSETKRRPIKKTILFPHRNTDLPFRQPMSRVVKEPTYERCESLTLQAIEELEPFVMYKSILEKMPQYDVKDKIASALAIRKMLFLGRVYVDDPRPPIPRRSKSKRQPLQTNAKGTQGPLENENCESREIIFVDEGQKCEIHGATIDVSKIKNCEIHGNSGIIEEDEKKILEED